jgi:hypothetical protein
MLPRIVCVFTWNVVMPTAVDVVAMISTGYHEAPYPVGLLSLETVLTQVSLCCRRSFIPNTVQDMRSSRWLALQVYGRSLTIAKSGGGTS